MAQKNLTDLLARGTFRQNAQDNFTELYGAALLPLMTPSNDDFIQRKSGVWVNRTIAQVKTDLNYVKADVGLGNVDNTADTAKPVSTAQQTALDLKANLSSFGAWTVWSGIGFTGFSANPTNVDASYLLINKLCIIRLTMTSGTSNATTFTITGLPAAAKAAQLGVPLCVDTVAGNPAYGRADFAAGSTTITLTRNANGAAWSNSGTKGAFFTITYEVQ